MHIVLLSGGSGRRLWPLSNEIRSKQFIKFFKKEDGTYESMLQRVHRQIRSIDPNATITIATSSTQVSAIHNQLGKEVGISVEPCRRDTFPAIALAASFVHDIQGVGEDEAVVVCPVDPFVDDDYFAMLEQVGLQAQKGSANLVLLGITPTYPSEKYGYIIPADTKPVSKVTTFKEKPDSTTAQTYIDAGALWNAGVFAFKLGYLLGKAHQLIDFTDYRDLYTKYETLTKISFDYAVVENEATIEVMRYSGQWKDLGTWNTLTEALSEPIIGKGEMDESCHQVQIINELNVPVLTMGLQDVIVCTSAQGILVSDKTKSGFIKPFVDAMDQKIMYAEKSWGNFNILDVGTESLTIKLTIQAGCQMQYHSHQRRNEVWNIVEGVGHVVLDGRTLQVHAGSVVSLPAGCRHTISAKTDLTVIEIQTGKDLTEQDKQDFQLE
jgi:mannose-1-phosphate guanylyltransferase